MAIDIHKNLGRGISHSEKQKGETEARRSTQSCPVLAAAPLVLFLIGVSALGAAANASDGSSRHTSAHTARTIAVRDTGYLHLIHNGGEYITEVGNATGTIPGKVRAYIEIGPVVVAKFTISTSAGSITGVGSGRPKGRSEEPSFAGTMKVSRGTGRYKHVRGHGGFYGTINLNPNRYKMVVQTTGTLSY
jgi:hypothetical protein